MATTFQFARGCVYAVKNSSGGTGGLYKLNGLPTGGDPPILITGADLSDTDVVMPVTTLSGTKIVYTFGQSIGDVRIMGLALLGSVNSGGGSSLSKLFGWFDGNRVSSKKGTVDLSMPGKSYRLAVVGFALGAPDTQFNIQPFVISAMIITPP